MPLEFDRNGPLGPRRFASYFCAPHDAVTALTIIDDAMQAFGVGGLDGDADTATLFAHARCVSPMNPMKSTRASLGASNMLATTMNFANAVRMAAR